MSPPSAEGCILAVLFACTFTACISVTSAQFQCPHTDCVVDCVSQTETDCDSDQILVADTSVCGCCAKCVGGAGLGEACSDRDGELCAVGLRCIDRECVFDKESCYFTKHIEDTTDLILPRCDPDGTYAAAQCKGDRSSGRCFCYSRTGQRIFGWEWWRNVNEPEEMTCGCSRRRYELETFDRRINVTMHCQANGDFEPLQCDAGLCWCANEKTGMLQEDSIAVPQDLWAMLPCYNSTIYGGQYLRQCDSVLYAQSLLRTTLADRGSTDVRFIGVQCHYDGTFGTYKIEGSNAYCTWRDGGNLSPYQDGSIAVSNMNCYCARDVKIFAEEGFTMPLACSANGNYALLQDLDGETFCVDQDGFVVSPTFTTTIHQEDCRKYVYYLL